MLGIFLTAALTISSPAFTEGGNIPSQFTCDAGQTSPSPALVWPRRQGFWCGRRMNMP